jgi:RNA polymerase sigma factor (sigma-70 family)
VPESSFHNENELVASLKQREKAAFGYLYENYSGALYSGILSILQDKELSNDVMQDAQKGKLYTWMVNICRNTAIDTLRSKSYKIQKQNRELTDTVYAVAGTMKIETDQIGLRKIVNMLKDEHKVLIELAYFQGYTQDEISKTLNVPLGTVKTRLRSALLLLKEFFKK